MIYLSFLTKIPQSLHADEKFFSSTIENSLKTFGVSTDFDIEIWFARRETIKRLNREFRHINHPTDVLSFPQAILPQTLRQFLGSIVICYPIVQEKQEDVVDVIKHGLLHLLHYDHETNGATWNRAATKIACNL